MLDLVRTSLHRAITTPALDGLLPVRVPKDLARRVNVMLGEPLCSKDELQRRREARARLAELRAKGSESAPLAREQAPVMIYHEGDRNARMLARIKETLDAKSITYTLLDVASDQATKEFVQLQAKCKEDELPIVFVGGVAIGGYNQLVEWQVSGRLDKAL
jgi:glutaredoxin